MKLTVLGGGGIRSMFLSRQLVMQAKKLNIDKIVFMDNDIEKLKIFGGMSKHVAGMLDPEIDFTLTADPVEALRDAQYIITTMRVGGDAGRVTDERIALRHGVLGQETTGAGGFAMALRSIPMLTEYCRMIKQYSKPDAIVFNFTNPAGLVSQALRDQGFDFAYGICDAPSSMLDGVADMFSCHASELETECYGLNHLSFFRSVKLHGKELLPDLLWNPDLYRMTDMRYFEPQLAQRTGALMNEYLYYYYYPEKAVSNIASAGRTRGEIIQEINQRMMEELRQFDVDRDFERCLEIFEKYYDMRNSSYMANETGTRREGQAYRFDIFAPDEGGYAGIALKYIKAIQTGAPCEMILCVPNGNSIAGLQKDDVVEVSCFIDRTGYHPKRIGAVNEIQMELIRRVKMYERLAAIAIVNHDRELAVEALMIHPLVNSYSIAKDLLKEYTAAYEAHTGDWR